MKKRVIIVGKTDLQKQLLAYVVERELQVPCSLETGTGQRSEAGQDERILFLMDSADAELESLLAGIKGQAIVGSERLVVALYNVESAASAERVGLLRGIQGFFYRKETIDLLLKGVRALLDGEIWLPREVLVQIAFRRNGAGEGRAIEDAGLTRREVEILLHVGAGHTNDEISEKLCLSAHTVKTHLYRVFKKIRVHNRFQASLWAAKNL